MLEYTTFCYLQNQKTGCTFVETFLRQFSSEPLAGFKKHAIVTQYDRSKFYFVNVREPSSLYRSLFAYGLDGKGTLYGRLKAQGLERLYAGGPAGFPDWLRFVLDPKNAAALSAGYTPALAKLTGFMSWRFLRLACLGFQQAAPGFTTRKELNDYVRTHVIVHAVLKQESLRKDLADLVKGPLATRIKDVPAALAWLEEAPKINTSESLTERDEVALDDEVRTLLLSRERALYRQFYPQAPGFAEWKARKDAARKNAAAKNAAAKDAAA